MFWLTVLILIVIGLVGFLVALGCAGDYDFYTPTLGVIFMVFFVALAIGAVIGKYVF